MFAPYGYLLSTIFSNLHFTPTHSSRKLIQEVLIVLLSAGVLSLIIECSQLFLMRGLCEYDDIFNNVIGALLGSGVYKMCRKYIPETHHTVFTSFANAAIGVVCICVIGTSQSLESYGLTSKSVCFQIDNVAIEEDRLELTGVVFDYEMFITDYLIILQSTETAEKVSLNTDYGIQRSDVNQYFECEINYSNTGFIASGKVNATEEYEIFLQTPWKALVSTDVFVTGSDIHYYPEASFIPPVVTGTDLENIIENGHLRVYRPDYSCWVYQYDGSLYWIVDQDFNFEEDGTTYIQYQLWTTQRENLPAERLENEHFWDNIGGDFEEYELDGNFGDYRVSKRELPTEYSITAITTGYHVDDEWIWQNFFRPIYEW